MKAAKQGEEKAQNNLDIIVKIVLGLVNKLKGRK